MDVAIFILDANPLAPSRPVEITITVPVIFTAIPVAAIPVSISIMSAAVVVPAGSRDLDRRRGPDHLVHDPRALRPFSAVAALCPGCGRGLVLG